MKTFVLTGGIGAGKSSVLAGLVKRGARAIDADLVVAELQRPGQAVFDAIVEKFGSVIVDDDGTLDRPALAALVFSDSDKLAALEAIVHPAVRKRIGEQLESHRLEAEQDASGSERMGPASLPELLVVIDIPLVVSRDDLYGADGLIVVDSPIEIVVTRLMRTRGMSETEVQQRIDRQISRADRLALADYVVDNSGSLAELEHGIEACWRWMQT